MSTVSVPSKQAHLSFTQTHLFHAVCNELKYICVLIFIYLFTAQPRPVGNGLNTECLAVRKRVSPTHPLKRTLAAERVWTV